MSRRPVPADAPALAQARRHQPGAAPSGSAGAAGFTLIEVLVVLAVLSLMALMAWRGLDAQLRRQQALQNRAEDLQTLQAALAQWHTDLAQLHESPELQSWHWDGRLLRLTRSSPAGTGAAVQVVAWSLQTPPAGTTPVSGSPHWMRWQSAPLATLSDWQQAWDDAARWADQSGAPVPPRSAGNDGLADPAGWPRAIALWPLAGWQLYVHRGGAWTNPLSSDAGGPAETGSGESVTAPTPDASTATNEANNAATNEAGSTATSTLAQRVPDAVRVQLALAPGLALAGSLQSDWVRPVFTTPRP